MLYLVDGVSVDGGNFGRATEVAKGERERKGLRPRDILRRRGRWKEVAGRKYDGILSECDCDC